MNSRSQLINRPMGGGNFLQDFAYGFSKPFEYVGAPLAAIGSAMGVPELAVLPAIGKAARALSGRGVILAGKQTGRGRAVKKPQKKKPQKKKAQKKRK